VSGGCEFESHHHELGTLFVYGDGVDFVTLTNGQLSVAACTDIG
jgi:hypothetical protein